jgi:hypothetical protein
MKRNSIVHLDNEEEENVGDKVGSSSEKLQVQNVGTLVEPLTLASEFD